MKNFTKDSDGIALIIIIFAMLVFSMLGVVVASMQSNYFEISRAHLRKNQAFFVSDSGMERGKELLNDSEGSWRPPDPPGYLREYMTVGGARGHYDIYVEELGGSSVELFVESQMDVE
ncbi:MAG: pilus assembly PilX N-terminal domain-containing protein [Candidatus Omnitrophica bacterium]|nr:pilus assembly PilX N-terminal domain-containing protein [Candidatus Omnitrophota bacterium]